MSASVAANAKKGKKPSAKKGSPELQRASLTVTVRNWFFRPTPLIITACLLACGVSLPYLPYLLPNLSQLDEYQFELDQMEVTAPHAWVPATLVEDVLAASPLQRQVSLLDPGLSRDVALALEQHPWVERVHAVRVGPERVVRAHVEYRQPVALVETNEGLYPVDVRGRLLPAKDFRLEDVDKLPRILNVTGASPVAVGEPFGGVLVLGAVRIAAALIPNHDLDQYWRRFELTGIVVPSLTEEDAEWALDDLTYELATSGGSRIIWGKAPGADDLEPSVEQKIGRLEQYLSRFGKFDEPNGPYRIDIRLFDVISLQPLNTLRFH